MKLWLLTCAVLFMMSGVLANPDDPLCHGKDCGEGEMCRVVETCDSAGSCTWNATCLQGEPFRVAGFCRIGYPLLTLNKTSGNHETRYCYPSYVCKEGFYCGIDLADAPSVCCRAHPVPSTLTGNCPTSLMKDTFFCVDTCRSDADCYYRSKCCLFAESCEAKHCRYTGISLG